jgi:dihydroorotase
MSKTLIRGGRVIDPQSRHDGKADVMIDGRLIAKVGQNLSGADEVFDASGLIVCPGLIDMHVHLREPGNSEEETIASGAAAAVAGGFTSVAAMANSEPAVDNEASAAFVYLKAEEAGRANVWPVGAVTKARAGEELAEMGLVSRAGAVAFSDDGDPVRDAQIMRSALEYARMFDRPVLSHCEVRELVGPGVMNEGKWSTLLGLPGMPDAAEEIMVARDVRLAELTGGRLHIQHATSRGSLETVRVARARGVRVSAEATPHHMFLTDECVKTFDPNFKMNPPLRTPEDAEALIAAVLDGTIEAIASDHAPHTAEEKAIEFLDIGLETTLGVVWTELVVRRKVEPMLVIERLTAAPARILNLTGRGSLASGTVADITVIDPGAKWTVDPSKFKSRSRNCPFAGRELTGRARAVFIAGKLFETT